MICKGSPGRYDALSYGRYWHDAVYKLPEFDALRSHKEELADQWHQKTENIYAQTLAAQVALAWARAALCKQVMVQRALLSGSLFAEMPSTAELSSFLDPRLAQAEAMYARNALYHKTMQMRHVTALVEKVMVYHGYEDWNHIERVCGAVPADRP